MQYSKQNYGSLYKCEYCGTEHHIDLLGRIEEYKVKLMWQGHLIEAYLNYVQFTPIFETFRSIEDNFCKSVINDNMLELNFTGHFVDE